ncbi:tRNA pseudouridine synthase D [Salinarchaeum sp. Harcht-Bsk1]|uniref:tRNA pseudouridine(13) synthase TruD n=1 Tax=Salinarchaeum sp. Harcht-Bsk1 TaxID=1333523 RepID=UPI00034236B4|nr:tRNA pseudouridine(13) synthase TruD [Salinarchaeum sp. Harcht-Bsk1]AGN00542.1 tRNA pseudouridine synthase D [Salinarchaeum sp. Harcht-Bsk1]
MADSSDDGATRRFDLRPAHPTEQAVGIEHYVTDVDGTGGRLRRSPDDFRVREIERIDPEPIDADPGAYGHVVVRATLRSWDTNDFAGTLSDRLGISRHRVHWAGTKDKRAVTTQLFSIDGVDPAVIPGAGAASSVDGAADATGQKATPAIDEADVEVLGRLGRSIELGDLVGNEFEVRITDAERPEHVGPITDALATFRTGGDAPDRDEPGNPTPVAVPNFFGQQRFGSRRPITHAVGLAIVRGEWREAVRIYVADAYDSEPDSTQDARAAAGDCFDDGDWTGALDAMPNRLGYERTLLHALERADADPGDDAAVFREALADLPENLQRMFVHAAQSYAFNRILSARLDAGLPFHEPVAGDVVCFADAGAPEEVALPDTDRLQAVTADRVDTIARHCERGRAFVTAPLVGTDTDLGDGDPGEIERRILDDLDLSPGDFDLPDPFGSTGTRRAVLVGTELSIDDHDEPTLSFALPKGSYATVLLREYLKVDPIALG